MMQSGQKLTMPAISGAIPKKNQGLPVIKPVAISTIPARILIGWHAFLILIIFIIVSSPNKKKII